MVVRALSMSQPNNSRWAGPGAVGLREGVRPADRPWAGGLRERVCPGGRGVSRQVDILSKRWMVRPARPDTPGSKVATGRPLTSTREPPQANPKEAKDLS